ncbi:hypothetical protein PoB_001800000 [Plakobranchus ocellatus]|uniref:Uncharacterized protein n=1 Tax=Plakobranchus ocellatus TaxID=259542 RepID=A0AAV3ZAC4_9GAST|nr:hypothetical protein PoB_001800000 [Plakobranchus ocellatus]
MKLSTALSMHRNIASLANKVGFLATVTAAPLLLYRLKMMADSTMTDIISNFLSLCRCWHDWLWHRLLGLKKAYLDHGYTSLEAKLVKLKVSVNAGHSVQ